MKGRGGVEKGDLDGLRERTGTEKEPPAYGRDGESEKRRGEEDEMRGG